MKKLMWSLPISALCLAAVIQNTQALETTAQGAEALYKNNCESCHGMGRLGGLGPALLPENLGRLKAAQAAEVIKNGRKATQMPAFGNKLNDDEIKQLTALIYQQPAQEPVWSAAEINASRILNKEKLGDKPVFDADLMNLFIVVETGDHHATLLNGDTFEPITRFQTRFALHGGPKYSPDGRYVFFASRDGWISKYDIYNLKVVAEVRAGINTRNIATSEDGKWVIAANYLPHNLVIFSAEDLSLAKMINTDVDGIVSRVSAVYTAPPRNSFIAAMKDSKEVWEIAYDKADFPLRRIGTDDYLDDFFFDPQYQHLLGASRDGNNASVIDLDSGKKIATVAIPGMPHLGSGIDFEYNGHPVLATPNLKTGAVTVVDMDNWQVVKTIETLGPGFFMRSHENTPYAWVDVFFGPNKDKMHVIDKKTLEMKAVLDPAPGKTVAHVEFTKDGKYALVSIWEDDGAVIVYDATTLQEIKRIPMSKPSGKYNVYNKTRYVQGTSH
ncbi:MAG: c-type cytochrome [Oceanospirillaceae bacterium]|nr:c-type cytochrome [Oceanospirillaceae bacterium]MCP5334445.1 c-type cytochrome [Oceanospirillaceae bacterium]MCP5350847.1 c-type cytochrome [Oceanospirillaceae bacterium]